MNPIIDFGISFITAFQSMGEWLESPMKFFSFLGSENFFLIFLPLLYWSVEAAVGIRVGFILFAGTAFTEMFKMSFHGPRPYWVSTDIRGIASETGFGVPSGHAEMGAGLWGMIAAYYRKTWVWVGVLLLLFFIGLSRLYLGVHFPHDVLVGWTFGFLTLWAFVKFWDPVETRIKQLSLWNQVGLAFVVSLAVVLLGALVIFLSRNFVVPAEWIVNATRNGNEAPNPLTLNTIITSAAAIFGLCTGLAWLARRGGFDTAGPIWKRAVRYVIGMVGLLVLYVGLKAIFPDGDTFVPYVFRYIRYAVIGFWVSGGAPWVFGKLNLTESK